MRSGCLLAKRLPVRLVVARTILTSCLSGVFSFASHGCGPNSSANAHVISWFTLLPCARLPRLRWRESLFGVDCVDLRSRFVWLHSQLALLRSASPPPAKLTQAQPLALVCSLLRFRVRAVCSTPGTYSLSGATDCSLCQAGNRCAVRCFALCAKPARRRECDVFACLLLAFLNRFLRFARLLRNGGAANRCHLPGPLRRR